LSRVIWILLGACGQRWSAEGVDLVVRSHPDRVHQIDLRISIDTPSPVSVQCTAQDDDDEVHVVRAAQTSSTELKLLGLLADTNYSCRLETDSAELAFDFNTAALPADFPSWTLSGDPQASDGAWTLFNHGENGHHADSEKLVIVDALGRVRWTYPLPSTSAADIDVTVADGQILYGGSGYGGRPSEVGLDWEISWQAPVQLDDKHYHHHVQDVPGMGVLTLVKTQDTVDGVSLEGFAIEILDRDSGEMVWRWSSQEAIEAGELPGGQEREDPFHANAAEWIEDQDGTAVLLSLKTINRVIRIDVESGAVDWTLGTNGAFTLLDSEGLPLGADQWFFGQHAPELNGDRLLVYDNGIGRPGGDRSRVVEYALDVDAKTLTQLWEWQEPDFLETVWGDVDRTPGGENVLVARAHCFNCPDAIAGTHSALVELVAGTGEEVWRLEFDQEGDAIYRAERLEGCALFTHATLCDR
jgi:hypothetical protein